MSLAMKLKQIRTARGLTQVALAKKVKMPQPYVARLESGAETNPKLDALRRLAKALRCKVSELVD
jgi:transcriptional regulator with XRE-family HTH domain